MILKQEDKIFKYVTMENGVKQHSYLKGSSNFSANGYETI